MQKKTEGTFLFYILVGLIIIVLAATFAIEAKAQQPGMGILCDERHQIESLAALAETGSTASEAIEKVNADAGKNACGHLRFISSEIEVLHRLTVSGRDLVILKLTIIALLTPTGPMPANVVQYTLAPAEGFVPARLGI